MLRTLLSEISASWILVRVLTCVTVVPMTPRTVTNTFTVPCPGRAYRGGVAGSVPDPRGRADIVTK